MLEVVLMCICVHELVVLKSSLASVPGVPQESACVSVHTESPFTGTMSGHPEPEALHF